MMIQALDKGGVTAEEVGFDWRGAAARLLSPMVRRYPWQLHQDGSTGRYPHQHHGLAWWYFEPVPLGSRAYPQPYYYRGNTPTPITMEDLTGWLWTPETASAFSLLLLALTVISCCYFSHKIGEWLCTAAAGLLATLILFVVFLVFISQWF